MSKMLKRISFAVIALALAAVIIVPTVNSVAYALEDDNAASVAAETVVTEGESETTSSSADQAKGSKALAAAIAVGLAAALGALAMGIAIAKSNEAIARQPEAASQIRSGLMLGLVFIETAIIYALIVAILVIFVL